MASRLVTADGELLKFVNVYLNDDDDVRCMDRIDTEVHAGDTTSILAAVAGGDE
jgi:molybdopterin converting factor small subunit